MSHERLDIAGAEGFHSPEGNMCGVSRLVATAAEGSLIACEHLLRIAGPGLSAPHAATLAPAFASKGRAASSNRPT